MRGADLAIRPPGAWSSSSTGIPGMGFTGWHPQGGASDAVPDVTEGVGGAIPISISRDRKTVKSVHSLRPKAGPLPEVVLCYLG